MRITILLVILFATAGYAGYTYLDRDSIDLEMIQQEVGLSSRLVDDQAGLLTIEDEKYIGEYHQMLLRRFDMDYRVFTANNLEDINQFTWKTFQEEEVGRHSKTGKGMLLVIDPVKDQLRIEVSGNLESVYTDAFISYLEHRQMVPFFNLGRVDDGIFATSELIRTRAIQAQEGIEFDPSSVRDSTGGGASAKAGIDAGRDLTFVEGKPDVLAADTPEETLQRFFNSMMQRNGRWDLDIFTDETKTHMQKMVGSAAQMDNTIKRYRRCVAEHVIYDQAGTRAVLNHALSNRGCDPFLFEKGVDGKWRLDLKTLGNALGHTFGNVWYLHYGRYEMSGIAKYNFGFKHLNFVRPGGEQFEHQGIPYYRSYGMGLTYTPEGTVIRSFPKQGGFMEKQGFKKGDVIIQWESIEMPGQRTISSRMEKVRPGLDIYVRVKRGDMYFEKYMKAPPYPKKDEYRFNVTIGSSNSVPLPMVSYIEPGEIADQLGIQKGDIITAWQGKEQVTARDIFRAYKGLKEGDPIAVQVYREERLVDLAGTMGKKRVMGKVH